MSNAMLDVTKEIMIDHDNVRDLFDRSVTEPIYRLDLIS